MHKGMTTGDVADKLGVDRSTVTRLVKSGKLRATKYPGRTGPYLFAPADVAKLAAKRGAA
jgi:excisionase family DNA binding protein